MGTFSVEARSQCNILQAMCKKIETLYTGLENYYVFDKQKYTLEEFMTSSTHDEIWNAAQRQLVNEGIIHNYLRMFWGKKIL